MSPKTRSLPFIIFVVVAFAGLASIGPSANGVTTVNTSPSPDFDGDGTVGFPDFLAFAEHFGIQQGDARFDARFDLDGDGAIGFGDFLAFAADFGKTVEPPPAAETWKLYWTEWGVERNWTLIRCSDLDGVGVEDLVTTGLDAPGGIALDVAGGKMYWTDWYTDKIQRSNLDGSDVEDLVTGLTSPYAIALDVAGGKMYWTDGIEDKIQRSNLDGSDVEDLLTGLDAPGGIALDVAGGKMYWTDGGDNDKIQRSNLDGSDVEDLVTGLTSPYAIALDMAGGKMYWADGGDNDKIQRSNLDGSGVEDLVSSGFWEPRSIALDVVGGKIYWTASRSKILRSNIDGSGVEELITGLDWPLGIALELVSPLRVGKDLVVRASVSENTLTPGQSFTLSATVRNRKTEQAAATTLRYYRSDDASISSNDTELGTDGVNSLSGGETSAQSISLNAPSSTGTCYYGACVDAVLGESDTGNNCSAGVSVTVTSGDDDGERACTAGLVVKPDESCTYKNGTFFVNSSGTGFIISSGIVLTAGNSFNERGTINGVRWNFRATRNSGSNSWTIHIAE